MEKGNVIKICTGEYAKGSPSIECDSDRLDEIYKKMRSAQSNRSGGETGSLMGRFFDQVIRPFSRSIAFGIFSIVAYAVTIRVFEKSDIPNMIGALSLCVFIISFAIDIYFKKHKTEH